MSSKYNKKNDRKKLKINSDSNNNNKLHIKAHKAVYKIMDDNTAQRHVALQAYCQRVLDPKGDKLKVNVPVADPIVELCLINVSKGDTTPNGFTLLDRTPSGLQAYILKGGGARYCLCYKRSDPVKEEMSKLKNTRRRSLFNVEAITDIRIEPRDEIPFGFTAITQTVDGEILDTPLTICYSRGSAASLQHLAFIQPQKGEKVPNGYQWVEIDLNASSTQQDDNTYLCFARDLSVYVDTFPIQNEGKDMNDPKYIPPLLVATHLNEGLLGKTAALSLQSLVLDGYFSKKTSHNENCLYAIIKSASDSIGVCSDSDFQTEQTNLCKNILKNEFNKLSVGTIKNMVILAFRLQSSNARVAFLELLVDWCIRAPSSDAYDDLPKLNDEFESKHFLQRIIDNVSYARVTERLLHNFNVTPVLEQKFEDIIDEINNCLFKKRSHKILGALILTLIKISRENEVVAKTMKYKFGLQRKHTSFVMLYRIVYLMSSNIQNKTDEPLNLNSLESPRAMTTENFSMHLKRQATLERKGMWAPNSPDISDGLANANRICMNYEFAFMFRRFFITSLVKSFTTTTDSDGEIVFLDNRTIKHILDLMRHLWKHYASFFKLDLGLIFRLFVDIARMKLAPIQFRLDILDLFLEMLTDQGLVNMYYNYDNMLNWNFVEKLITALREIAENAVEKDGNHIRKVSSTAVEKTVSARSRGITVEYKAVQSEDDVPKPKLNVTNSAVKSLIESVGGTGESMLALNEQLQHKAIEVIVYILKLLDTWHQRHNRMEELIAATPRNSVSSPSGFSLDSIRGRKDTVMVRTKKHKKVRQAVDKALRLARQKSLKKAVAHLIALGVLQNDGKAISDFVHDHLDRLDLEVVGEFLGGTAPVKEAPLQEDIRVAYIQRLQMQNMSLQDALRIFLTESGFRLPKESQKIERILESWAKVYTQESHIFDDADAGFVMANAILMLNTSLHNPFMKDSDRITKKAFLVMCGGIEGSHLTHEELEAIYDDIKKNGYAIALTENIRAPQQRGSQITSSNRNDNDDLQKFSRKMNSLIRRSMNDLKRYDCSTPVLWAATSSKVVLSLLEDTWFQFMDVLSSTIETAHDAHMVAQCFDGFTSLLRLCTRLRLYQEREAIGSSLARFSFIFKKTLGSEEVSDVEITRGLVTGQHLEQAWLKILNGMMSGDEFEVEQVSECVGDIKRQYIRDTNRQQLREVQERLIGDVSIVSPSRFFIREGNISKISSNGQFQPYRLFLFSDVLVYCDQTAPNTFKPHRVLNLAFCSLVMLRDKGALKNLFRIKSPQKTVTLKAQTPESRDAWVGAIRGCISKCRVNRDEIIDLVAKIAEEGKKGIQQAHLIMFRTSAVFLYHDVSKLQHGEFESTNDGKVCPLCLRTYSWFSRRSKCKLCKEQMCSRCINHKVAMGNSTVTVCDGCYGLSKEFISKDENKGAALRKVQSR